MSTHEPPFSEAEVRNVLRNPEFSKLAKDNPLIYASFPQVISRASLDALEGPSVTQKRGGHSAALIQAHIENMMRSANQGAPIDSAFAATLAAGVAIAVNDPLTGVPAGVSDLSSNALFMAKVAEATANNLKPSDAEQLASLQAFARSQSPYGSGAALAALGGLGIIGERSRSSMAYRDTFSDGSSTSAGRDGVNYTTSMNYGAAGVSKEMMADYQRQYMQMANSYKDFSAKDVPTFAQAALSGADYKQLRGEGLVHKDIAKGADGANKLDLKGKPAVGNLSHLHQLYGNDPAYDANIKRLEMFDDKDEEFAKKIHEAEQQGNVARVASLNKEREALKAQQLATEQKINAGNKQVGKIVKRNGIAIEHIKDANDAAYKVGVTPEKRAQIDAAIALQHDPTTSDAQKVKAMQDATAGLGKAARMTILKAMKKNEAVVAQTSESVGMAKKEKANTGEKVQGAVVEKGKTTELAQKADVKEKTADDMLSARMKKVAGIDPAKIETPTRSANGKKPLPIAALGHA